MAPSPSYKVYISHAEEDKATIALPLREKLLQHGIAAFVAESNTRGTRSRQAMPAVKSADIAVVVLSPEFVARKSPMKELLAFLERCDKPGSPLIIPLCYRLNLNQLYDEPRLDRCDGHGRSIYTESRFFQRMRNEEPEANIANIKVALRKVHAAEGVQNHVRASNDSTTEMAERRNLLLQQVCGEVQSALTRLAEDVTPAPQPQPRAQSQARAQPQPRTQVHPRAQAHFRARAHPRARAYPRARAQLTEEEFRPHYYKYEELSGIILDFMEDDEDPEDPTFESKVLQAVINTLPQDSVISIQGINGVGKRSILRGLSRLDALHRRFKDGVHFLSFGGDASRYSAIDALSGAVGQSGGPERAMEMRLQRDWKDVFTIFRGWFSRRQCLFMIDELRETSDLSASMIHEILNLHRSGAKSKLLFTSRSMETASRAELRFVLIPRQPQAAQCRAIFMRQSGIEVDEANTDVSNVVTELLTKCCGLPLFLKIAGQSVKSLSNRPGNNGIAAIHVYNSTLAKSLQSVKDNRVDSYDRLAATLSVSVDLLQDRRDRLDFPVRLTATQMHRRLSVNLKQSVVPMTMLRHLWELPSKVEAAIVAREFEQVGLAFIEVEKKETGYAQMLGVHDSLLEYATGETQKRGEEKLGHIVLLDGYGRGLPTEKGCRLWW